MSIPKVKSSANVTTQNEPWVLAKHCTQCFFITDPSRPSRVVVRRGKSNIAGMDKVANEEDFDAYGDPNIEDDDNNQGTYTTRRSRTTVPPKSADPPYTRKSQNVGLNFSTATKKGKKIAIGKR